MDPDTDVCQTEQPQISYSVDFTAEQSRAMGSPILLDREGIHYISGLKGSFPPTNGQSSGGLLHVCVMSTHIEYRC